MTLPKNIEYLGRQAAILEALFWTKSQLGPLSQHLTGTTFERVYPVLKFRTSDRLGQWRCVPEKYRKQSHILHVPLDNLYRESNQERG